MTVTVPLSESGITDKNVVSWVNKELIPLLRQLKSAANTAPATSTIPGLLRVVALTDAATVTIDADATDVGTLATLGQATQFDITGGVAGQKVELRVISSVARALTFTAAFRDGTSLSLPVTTSGGGLMDRWFFDGTAAASFDIVGEILGVS